MRPFLLTPAKGDYALLIYLADERRLQIGALGVFDFPAGYYVYVGSARGSGGLRARVGRHLRPPGAKPRRWHIDWLLAAAAGVDVFSLVGEERQECAWAAAMQQTPGAQIVAPGFGASDCSCPAHLIYLPQRPELETLLGGP